ncbi:MAG: hypothetical protein FWF96_00665 [Kiritimatiellaeota bacterium]|nr:hypothetical protein [Kiritimatiellota bacterium]
MNKRLHLEPVPRLAAAIVSTLAFLTLPGASRAQDARFTWLEVEDGKGWDAIPNVQIMADDMAPYSGGKAIQFEISAADSAAALGETGKTVSWAFAIAEAGAHDAWFRIGYEWLKRADIDWRVDNGEWQVCSKNNFGVDLRQIAPHGDVDISWVPAARGLELAAGAHTLELRFKPQTKEVAERDGTINTVADRVVFLGDAIVFAQPGTFEPYGHWRPGEDHQTDADRAAAAFVFEEGAWDRNILKPTLCLEGEWELARVDEWVVNEGERLQPMSVLPADLDALRWSAITVPHADLEGLRFDYRLAHRVLFRTRVFVPEAWKGRSFQLDVPNFSMIIGAFVNGQYLGGSKNFLAQWTVDATAAIKPGEVNEIIFSMKNRRYGHARTGDPVTQRRWDELGARLWFANPPWNVNWSGPNLDMPMASRPWFGLLETPSLVVSGPVYTADVFVKTWVTQRNMAVEYEVHNPSGAPVEVELGGAIRPWSKETPVGAYAVSDVAPVIVIPARKLTVPAGQTVKVEASAHYTVEGAPGGVEGAPAIKLWWPTDPRLYVLTTTVASPGGVDSLDTRFGFREWGWRGDLFTLNGAPWQLWAEIIHSHYSENMFDHPRQTGQNNARVWVQRDRKKILDAMDEEGMIVRNSGSFEGMGGFYWQGMARPGWNTLGQSAWGPFRPLYDNWIPQLLAQVKSERNHPSILIWSIENEIVYIASNNQGYNRLVEPEIRRGAQAVENLDPTRPTMVDGGRALFDQSMPVNGAHYDDYAGRARRDLPDAFYDNSIWYTEAGKSHGPWIMAKGKPVFHGEAFFSNGWRPVEYTIFGGENAAIGHPYTRAAQGLYMKMMSEGYRWDNVAAWHFLSSGPEPLYFPSWKPVAALAREWDRTFTVGKPFTRTFKLYNQTQFATPITVRWALHKPGEEPAVWDEKEFTLPPGGRTDPWQVDIQAGELADDETAAGRGPRVLTVRCVRDGGEVFREDKNVWILNPDAAPMPDLGDAALYVWDAHGAAKQRLGARGIPFREVASLEDVPQGGRLIVGADTLTREQASSAAWMRFALAGGRVAVLDQNFPMRHQALPFEAEPTGFTGRIAFIESPDHPVFAGLTDDDFFCRSSDHITYRNVWRKGAGMKSLAQCDEELGCSAFFEAPAGDGLLALCQFAVGEKLNSGDPVMTRLFDNLVNRVAAYTPLRRELRSVLAVDSPAARALSRTGIPAAKFDGIAAALPEAKADSIILMAPMSEVAETDPAKLKAFIEAGGWLVVNGLAPEHLTAFNALAGVEHQIRPMEMERVKIAAKRDALAAGLSPNDLTMNTGKRITDWMELFEPVTDLYTYVVDANDDIAAFAPGNYSDTDPEPGKGARDHYSRNMINGFTHDDIWMFIWQPPLERAHWAMAWDKPSPLAALEITPNQTYQHIKTIELRFDDDPAPMLLDFTEAAVPQSFDLGGRAAQKLSFKPVAYHAGRNGPTGIDTLAVFEKRPDTWRDRVHPIDNIGGLVRYNLGRAGSPLPAASPLPAGGVVLINVNFMDEEVNPANKGKKDNILKALLLNLGAVSAQGGH